MRWTFIDYLKSEFQHFLLVTIKKSFKRGRILYYIFCTHMGIYAIMYLFTLYRQLEIIIYFFKILEKY